MNHYKEALKSRYRISAIEMAEEVIRFVKDHCELPNYIKEKIRNFEMDLNEIKKVEREE